MLLFGDGESAGKDISAGGWRDGCSGVGNRCIGEYGEVIGIHGIPPAECCIRPAGVSREYSLAARSAARLRIILLIDETLGAVLFLHTPSAINLSLISQAKIVGFSFL